MNPRRYEALYWQPENSKNLSVLFQDISKPQFSAHIQYYLLNHSLSLLHFTTEDLQFQTYTQHPVIYNFNYNIDYINQKFPKYTAF
jgi:hypothetical protein